MIPNDQPLRREVIQRMITTLLNNMEDNPAIYTEWEEDFVSSAHEQVRNRGDLTSKQCEILERIHDK